MDSREECCGSAVSAVNIHNNRGLSEKNYNAIAHCIKQILYTRNNNLITPFAFERNLAVPIASQIAKKLQQWTANGRDVEVWEQLVMLFEKKVTQLQALMVKLSIKLTTIKK